MPKQRRDFLTRAGDNGDVGLIHESVNGDKILDKLEPMTERRHQEKLDDWDL